MASPEVKAAREKIQAGDVDGGIADLRKITSEPQSLAPLDAYGALLETLDRRNKRVEFTATLDDLAKRYSADTRVPFFLLNTAKSVMQQNKRAGHVLFARDLLRKVVQAYPASPAAIDAGTMIRQIESTRGRGRG